MWRKFLNDEFDQLVNYPPEGETVVITDGKSIDTGYYIMSGEYRWVKYDEETGEELKMPFNPTHWMTEVDYKIQKREDVLNTILNNGN